MGFVFERMCQQYLLRYADDLPIELCGLGQWRGSDPKTKKQMQIDLVGMDVGKKEFLIGSCKFKNEKIGVDELVLLKEYAAVFGKGERYHYCIFSKSGFTQGLEELAKQDEVMLIDLADMYEGE